MAKHIDTVRGEELDPMMQSPWGHTVGNLNAMIKIKLCYKEDVVHTYIQGITSHKKEGNSVLFAATWMDPEMITRSQPGRER